MTDSHVCDSGCFDRAICPEPCGSMHSFCTVCGERQDYCPHAEVERLMQDRDDIGVEHAAMFAELAAANARVAELEARLADVCCAECRNGTDWKLCNR